MYLAMELAIYSHDDSYQWLSARLQYLLSSKSDLSLNFVVGVLCETSGYVDPWYIDSLEYYGQGGALGSLELYNRLSLHASSDGIGNIFPWWFISMA